MTNLLKTTAILVCCLCISFAGKAQQNGTQDRAFWVETLTRIADPVLTNLSNNTLKRICLTNLYRKTEVILLIWKR